MKKMEYQELVTLQSTELLFLESELAGIGGRALAYAIDSALRVVGSFSLLWALSPLFLISDTARFIVIGTILLANSLYYVLLEWLLGGKTAGKYTVGIRVIKRDGTRISLLDSLLRNILRTADFLPFGYLAGICVMFIDAQNRRLGDIIADTTVVYDRPKHRNLEAYLDSQILTQQANPLCIVRGVERLGQAERTIVKDLYSRIEKLEPRERNMILDKFKEKIVSRLEVRGSGDPKTILYEIYKKL